MDSFDDFIHRLHCSMHPQLRHYSFTALKDPAEYRHHLRYWSLPDSFRAECNKTFQATGTTGYYSWNGKCVFSFDCLLNPCPHAVLLRNIYVPREYRGQHCCTDTLSQITRVAESSGTCIVAIVHPFEISTDHLGLKAVVDALHRSEHGISYVGDKTAKCAMNARLKKAGFCNCDLRDSMSPHGEATIPLTNQWIFLPKSVDQQYLASISKRLVNESVDGMQPTPTST